MQKQQWIPLLDVVQGFRGWGPPSVPSVQIKEEPPALSGEGQGSKLAVGHDCMWVFPRCACPLQAAQSVFSLSP